MRFSYYPRLIFHHFKSNNRHGTHSPHVYTLLDEWVYSKGKGKMMGELNWSVPEDTVSKGVKKTLLRVFPYYNIQNVFCLSDLKGMRFDYTDTAIVVAKNTLNTSEKIFLERFVSQGGVVVWYEMYIDNRRKAMWDEFISQPCVTLMLDFFHFGLTYQRLKQQREQFSLKYPYFS